MGLSSISNLLTRLKSGDKQEPLDKSTSTLAHKKTQRREKHTKRRRPGQTEANENNHQRLNNSLCALGKPLYWSQPSTASTGSRGFKLCPIPVKTKLFDSFRNVLETDKPEQLNIGRDVKEKGEYTSLDLVGVWRIENHNVWNAYAKERIRIRKELKKHNLTAPHFYMRQNLYDSLGNLPGFDKLNEDINETYLIHGTAPQWVGQILRNGLAPPKGKCEALFGKGIYFAEDSCKNDQYGVGDTWRSNDDLHGILFPKNHIEFKFPKPPYKAYYILLCRVIVGYHVSVTCTDATSKTMENNFHPDHAIFANDDERELAFCPNNDSKAPRSKSVTDSSVRYHCLVAKKGGAIVRFREFCQFHANRVYPEYLICYTRK